MKLKKLKTKTQTIEIVKLEYGQYMKPEDFDTRLLDIDFVKRRYPTILLTGPSAVGKGSLIFELISEHGMRRVVRHTTRSKGEFEVNEEDYYFISNTEFEQMIKAGEFIEWGYYGPGYYGTSIRELNRHKQFNGAIIIDFDIDALVTTKSILLNAGVNVLDIMMTPCTLPQLKSEEGMEVALEILLERMRHRNRGEDERDLKGRLKKARIILERYPEVEYVIENAEGQFNSTVDNARRLISSRVNDSVDLSSNGYSILES